MAADNPPPPPAFTPWQFLDALGEGIYGVDPVGCCIFVNTAAVQMLGYDQSGELIGRNMHETIHHTRADGSPFPQAECPLLHTATSGLPVRLENEMLWRRDGTPFFAEYSSFPVRNGDAIVGSIIAFRDTSVRQDAQKRLSVQYAVSRVLASRGGDDTMPAAILRTIGTGLAWDVGLFWLCDLEPSGKVALRCKADWSAPGVGDAAAFAHDTVGATLDLNEGLPGRVWASEHALHVADPSAETGDANLAEAVRLGLRSALSFPLIDGKTVVGVIEFYSRQRIALDESLLEALSALGNQIGQALERRGVTEALGASERLKTAILASSPDAVITIDATGHILEFNAAAERIFGRSFASVNGRELAGMIFPPDTQELHRKAFSRALDGDAAVIGRRIEVEAINSEALRFPIELSITRTASGFRPLFTVHLRDISARRLERAKVRQSEARFRTIANAIPQLAWMTDAEGSVTWYNQRWYDYTGSTFADMAGWGWRSVHHPDHLDRVERHLRESFVSGESWEDTFPLRSKDGDYNWFLSRALPIREEPDEEDPDGRILGWFGTNTDVTSMRESEQSLATARDEAEAANRAKSTFIANMSHELRTPLSAIIGYAEMLTEEIEDGATPTDLARDVQKIEGNARHLLGLINDVLDLSKVESGKLEAYIEPIDVAEMVSDVAATIGALMAKNDNRFSLTLADGLGTMHSDVTRIRQILLNLLGNAAKFTENGEVTLAVERRQGSGETDWIAFSVSDTGLGMTEEQLASLFQRFQQADVSTTRQFGGTGLGLALTKAFATLLGGEVDVTSVFGQGSTFTIRLPASLQADTMTGPEAISPSHGDNADGDIVLVVDDDETQRDLTSRFLQREGFVARLAADGPTGLRLAKQLHPKAILLDVTMPGMDGWSVLSALKADPDLADIPVVMVTFVSDRALASSLGASDYVIKPVNWDRLRNVMERFRGPENNVLVIDDDTDTRHRIRQILERSSWRVSEAADGQQAMESIGHALPHVILLDLNMPVMDGFAFLREVRARPGCESVPIVVLTARDLSVEDRRRLRGADQLLAKGETSLRDLAEKLRTIAAASRTDA